MPIRFGHRQETPIQRLVLVVLFTQMQRRHRFAHFKAKIKRMRRIDIARPAIHQCIKNFEGIGIAKMLSATK